MVIFRQDQPVHIIGKQAFDAFLFLFDAITVVRQHGLIARFVGDQFNAFQHVGKNVIGERWQQYADGFAFRVG